MSLPGIAAGVARMRASRSGHFTVTFTNPAHPSELSEPVTAADATSSATAHYRAGYASCITDSTYSLWDGVGWKAGSRVSYRVGAKTIKTVVASRDGSFATSVSITCDLTVTGAVNISGVVYADTPADVQSNFEPC